MAINKNCPCKREKCERRGKCDECRAYHAKAGRQIPVSCEKGKAEIRKEKMKNKNTTGV